MATRQSDGVSGFLQNFAMLQQVMHQRQQLAQQARLADMQEKRDTLGGYQAYLNLIRSSASDPTVLDQVQAGFEQTGLFDPDALRQIRETATPSPEAFRMGAAQRGMRAATPEQVAIMEGAAASGAVTGLDPGALASSTLLERTLGEESPMGLAARARATTGMAPGDVMAQYYRAKLPEQFFANQELIASGQALSAAQAGQLDLGWAGERRMDRIQTTQLALQEVGLEMDMAKLRMAQDAGQNPMPLIEDLGKNIRSWSETRASRSIPELAALTNVINSQVANLTQMGVLAPQWYRTPDNRMIDATTISPDEARAMGWAPVPFTVRPEDTAVKNPWERIMRSRR